MKDSDLEELLSKQESDRVERKASFSDPSEARKAVCAFANDLPGHGTPGVLFIGVKDDGSCAGLKVDDELLRDLADMRSDGNIQPLPSLTVEKRVLGGCEMAVVVVQPALAPPVRYKGTVWIRVGPRKAIASAEEERRLAERRRSRDLPFDLQPLSSASLEDLDLRIFQEEYLPSAVAPEVREKNERKVEEKLRALRFLSKEYIPTVLGALVLGKDPRRFVPGDYIQFLRIDGKDLADPVRDQKEIDGPLSDLIRRLDEVMEAHNQVAVSITEAPVEVQHPEYPLAALQQITRNAVLHRNYETTNAPVRIYWFPDRIEIHSPGGPYGQVTPENFGSPGAADYRNPHLAEAMRALGYVQRFGVGIQIARRELERNGNPPPDFQVEPTNVLVTVRRRP
jgi:ATP-dependent DNA helicase RecG